MKDPTAFRRPRRLAPRLATVAFCLISAGCAGGWYAWTPKAKLPPDPDAGRGAANELVLGQVFEDSLHCAQGDCKDWFFVVVERAGDLEIEVTLPPQASPGALRMVLEDTAPDGSVLPRFTDWDDPPPLRIRTRALPGPYYFFLENDGARASFQVLVVLEDS